MIWVIKLKLENWKWKVFWNHHEYQEYISRNLAQTRFFIFFVIDTLISLTLINVAILFFLNNSVYWRQRSTAGPWPSWSTLWCYSHTITLWPPLRLVAASPLTSKQMEDIHSGRPRSAVTAFVTLPMATVPWKRCLGTSRWDWWKCIQRKWLRERKRICEVQIPYHTVYIKHVMT